MLDELKDVVELATSLTTLTKEIFKLKPNNKNKDEDKIVIANKDSAKICSSGDYAKIGSSGYYAKICSSGNSAKIGSSGDYAKICSSGDYVEIGSSGYSAKICSSGDSAKIGSSGDYAKICSSGNSAKIGSSDDSAKICSSGNSAKIGSSGYSAKICSSGDYAKIGSSGYSAKICSSGDSAKIGVTGNYTIACAIGNDSIVKGKIGTWITLAEFDEDNKPICVKSAQIDGIELKEDTYYILQDKNFKECVVIDDIISVVVNRHKNVLKVKNLGDEDITFIVKDGEMYAHGATIKEAKESLLYKISNRDTSKYNNFTLDTKLTKKQAIEMYRVITGACEAGTRYFVEHNKIPRNLTVAKVIEITENQYGNNKLKEFFDV